MQHKLYIFPKLYRILSLSGIYFNACLSISTALLGKALQSSGKSFAIFGFNKLLYTHKNFGEKFKLSQMPEIVQNTHTNEAGYNDDGYMVKKVSEILQQQPQQNKILIVISDGHPEESPEHSQYNLKEEVLKAEKIAKVYSIGIHSDAVKRYYKRYVVIKDITQLGGELMKIFKENIGKRVR